MEVGDRVYVDIAGKTGKLLGWDGKGSFEVRLEDDPEYVSRWFAAWDVESIEPYPDGHPEGERLMEIGRKIINEALDKHMRNGDDG